MTDFEEDYPGQLLHQAAFYDNVELLQELLDSSERLHINAANSSGQTALHSAVAGDSRESLQMLLQAGADPGIASGMRDNCRTPLHHAVSQSKVECVKVLVDGGASLEVKDGEGKTAYHLATALGNRKILDILQMEKEAQRKIKEIITADLYQACVEGRADKAAELISQLDREVINAAYNGGSTLLYRASQLGHESVVHLLLNSGAEAVPNVGTGLTPLHAACWTGQVNIAILLLQHLPQFAGMDSSQSLQLPIHVAASQGHLDIVNVLLNTLDVKDPASVNSQSQSNQDTATFDINALDLNWHSSLHLAVLESRVSVVEALLQWSARSNTASVTEGNPASPRSPLEDLAQRITVDTYSVLGRTPLHDAVKNRDLAIVTLLLQHGANPDLPAKKVVSGSSPYNSLDSNSSFEGTAANMTALAEAASSGSKDIVATLLKYGAKDTRDAALQSALTNGHTDIAGLLLSCSGVAVDLESKINRRLQLFLERSCSVEEDNVKSMDSLTTLLSSDGTMASGNLGTGTLARTSTRNKAVRVNWCWRNLQKLNIEWFIEACVHLNHSLVPSKSALVCITKIDVSDNQIVQLPKEIFVDMDSLQHLNSCNNCISSLPEFKDDDSFNSPSLKEVDISGNRLSAIPTWIFQLPALEILNLSNNRLKTLPFSMWTSQKLTYLDISVNLLEELPSRPESESECVVQTTHTEEDRQRTETNSSKESNESFHTPNGSDGEREPDASSDAKTETSPLQRRESTNNLVQPWKPTNPNCKRRKLNRINIWEKDVATSILTEEFASEVDDDSASTSALDFLNLAWNKLTAVPTGLPCLAPRLSKLDLSHNTISDTGPPNAYPKGLTKLLLQYNKIEDSKRLSRQDSESCCYSPYASSLRTSVSGASIADIRISRSESVLSQISFLSLLSLCHHRRHSILPSLKILDLSDNQIESLELVYSLEESRPPSLSDAEGITSKSHSTGDPAQRKRKRTSESSSSSLDQLTNLHPLYPKLSTLNVSNNRIKVIPADMGLYQDLTMLYISDNKDIRTLPMELGKLEKLWDFRANGMELEEPLQGLQIRSTRHLIGYLRSILDQSRPYCRMKLMLVGLQGVGKTSLLHEMRREGTGSYQEMAIKGWASRMNYFRNDQKTRKGQNISTVGVDVADWTYVKKVKKRPCELGEVTFSTWDFGGQREYYATHQYFLSKRSLYLACWKITDGEKGIEDLQQWLINIQARAPDSPVIIVGTHYDEFKKYPPSFLPELRDMIDSRFINLPEPHLHGLPRVKGQLEVSCKNHHNIRELCDLIYDTVFQLKVRGGTGQLLLKQPIPATYLALQKTVAQIAAQRKKGGKHPVLVGDQYKIEVMTEMMRKENLCFRDHEELKQATQFLHENGVLLHYEDVALKDLYFLDPQWLCDMLAHVITIPEINGYVKNGILETKCLSLIFKSAAITPVDIRLYIVDLLNKFEVALTWDNKNLLIPSLLPTEDNIKKLVTEGREVKITMKRKGKKSKAMVMKSNKDPYTSRVSRHIHVSRPEKISTGKSTFYKGATSSPLPAPPSKEDVNGNNSSEEKKSKLKVTYTDQFLRFYLMSYFPSGFWSRLITRVFADDHLYDTAVACFEAVSGDVGDGPVQVLMESPHWVCWQTGFKLRHCNTTLLTVKEVIGEEDERKKYSTLPLSTRDMPSMAGYHGGKLQISVPLSEVKYSYTHTVSTPTSISEEVQKRIVLKTDVAIATRLLAVVVDHLDLLLQDWYSDIGERFRQTSHGLYLVRRVIPCPKCQRAAGQAKQPKKKQKDVHHRGDAWEVVEVSPQDHEPYVSKTIVSPVNEKSKSTASEKTMQATESTDTTLPSAAKNAEEETSEDLMFQLELSTEMKQGADKVENDAKNEDVVVAEVPKREEYTEPKKPLSLAFVEPAEPAKGGGTQKVSEDQPGKQRKGKKSNAESAAITTFQFDDLVYQSLSHKTVECPRHGTLLLKTLVPDVMFEDIATKLLLDPSEITTQRLLGTGAFGFVFQGLRKTRSAPGTSVALKILEPRDPGKEAPDTAKKEYAQHKRKWTQEPTWAACKAYCTVRQEMMVLSSLTHAHIVSLLGVCHQPLCLVLELACRGALDTRLREYRREGARLDPCLVQHIVVQISSAISYLHSHRIIYRDLKAQNVLVWSLPAPTDEPTAHVHVKLADYGISRAAMPRGEVKGYGGSPGYMAPEIVQHYGMEAYTEKVDCFSFAMFLYELLSLKQPFEGLDQINDLILREKRPPLTEKERSYPTNILDIMSLCWSHDPHNRPKAADIHKAARCPEFPLLLQAMPVADGPGKTALVACATYSEQVQIIDDGYGGLLEQSVSQVWLCNLAQNGPPTQVDILQVVDGRLQEEAMAFEVPDVVCRVCIIGDMIWMGIDKPVVHIYRLSTLEKLKTLSLSNNVRRTNTVRSILHIPDTRTILVALSLGTVVQYKYSGGDRHNVQNSDPITVTEVHRARLEFHTFSAAIVTTVNRSTELWLGGCDGGMRIVDGESLVVLKDLNHFDPKCSKVNVMHLATRGGPDRPGVGGNVWSYVYPGTMVYKWEVNTWYNTHKLDCKDHLPNLDAGGCQVTCLQVQGGQLYVGTVWGHLLICDAAKMTCLAQVKGHVEDVKYIIPVCSGLQLAESALQQGTEDTQSNKQQKSQLLTIGLGYNYLLQNHIQGSHVKQGRTSLESILLVWDADSWELAAQC
ncbi:PREDICTED: leucine-rich repeat serine/threonine-protein kinase 1-like [Branchiostoma belcheri]|uniref:non-specific serine/threonine protein kinase n=1 Tax=Branchiostoma belcheri TaxID=7741 RepID=A0A6P4XYW1_BRABE|nr:PREDICTED: leucine-rich repeat serine/threonine-protein kinase 1-like [Branchiostoma belcheri]